MITTDIKDLLKDLKELEIDITRRLEKMVRGFMYEFSVTAISNTPLGDANNYENFYLSRQKRLGLEPTEGYAQGNWQIVMGDQFSAQDNYSGDIAENLILSNLQNYKLGATVTLGNAAPYIGNLEYNYQHENPARVAIYGEGITKPTVEFVLGTYKIDLVRYYQQN